MAKNLKVHLTANTKKFNAGMNKARAKIKKFGKSVKSMSLLGGGALLSFGYAANRMTKNLDEIGKSSKKLGVSTDFFQKMSFAADRSGASVGNVSAGMKRMARMISDANNKLITAQRPLEQIGVDFKALQGIGIEKQFLIIGEALNKVTDGSKKAALAQELFGRAGVELIPMIQDYKELAAEAESLGIIIDEKVVSAGERFQDSLTNITKSLTSTVMNSGFVPWLADVAEGLDVVVNRSAKLSGALKKLGANAKAEYTGFWLWKKLKSVETGKITQEAIEKERLKIIRKFRKEGRDTTALTAKASDATKLAIEKDKKLEETKKRMANLAEKMKSKQKELALVDKLKLSLAEKLERFKLKSMTNEQKSLFFAEKRKKLIADIAKETSKSKQLKMKIKLVSIDDKISGLEEDKDGSTNKSESKKRLSGAIEQGTVEAYRMEISRNKKSPESETAKNTKKSVDLQKRILEETKKGNHVIGGIPAYPIG